MVKINRKDVPTAIVAYYIAAAINVICLGIIKVAGWTKVTNFFFFLTTIIALGLVAYILHIYFKEDTSGFTKEERLMKFDYGQTWVALVHVILLGIFLVTW